MEILGEDKAYIFIDTDSNSNTGYHQDWLTIGADYMLEIKGKDGQILSKGYYVFKGHNQNDWEWLFIGNIAAKKDNTRLETQISQNEIGLGNNVKFNVFFCIMDWNDKKDVAGNEILSVPGLPLSFPHTDLEFYEKRSSRAINIGDTDDTKGTAYNNQRKIVRNNTGIWFAFWHNESTDTGNNELWGAYSTDTTGSSWNEPVELVGDNGIIQTQTTGADYPSIAINSTRDQIHIVWVNNSGGIQKINYSHCIDLNHFGESNYWRRADNVTFGCEKISTASSETCDYPCIAVNSTGKPHVLWTQNFNPGKIYYANFSRVSNSWCTPVNINTSGGPPTAGAATLDIDSNDNLHLAWGNQSSGEVCYRRCNSTEDSRDPNNWKKADGNPGYDIVIHKDNFGMHNLPSMVCDSGDNVWVVVHELSDKDIWYNKCTGSSWGTENTISTTNELEYPTICADNNGVVYCVWRNSTDEDIVFSLNSGSGWTQPVNLTSAFVNYYPNIEKNILGSTDIGIVYTNTSQGDVMFYLHQVPEFSTLIFPLVMTSMIMLAIFVNKRSGKIRKKKEDSG